MSLLDMLNSDMLNPAEVCYMLIYMSFCALGLGCCFADINQRAVDYRDDRDA